MSSRSGWTTDEKVIFMNKLILQLINSGGKYDLQKIQMPGRTPKALTHLIEKIKKSGDEGTANSPQKRKADDDLKDEGEDGPKPNPKKKRGAVKQQEDDENDTVPVKAKAKGKVATADEADGEC